MEIQAANQDPIVNNLRRNIISGIGWTTIGQLSKQILQFIISIVLARLLTPQDFGLVGMVAVFTGFAAMFNELGLSAALIQRQNIQERHYSTIFWLNLCVGLLLTLIMVAIAPYIALFYGENRLVLLTRLTALNYTIGSLTMVQIAILNRTMNFRLLIFVEIMSLLVGGGIAIALAFWGYGVWSLIWQTIIASSITAVALWWVYRWRPQFIFDRATLSELLGFSSNLLGFRVINYWVRNGDNLLVGKFMGTDSLGVYTRAYTLMLLPLSQVTNVLSRVMFSGFSRISNDNERVKRIYLRSIAMIALVTFPMMLGLWVVADHFVIAIFGQKWISIASLLKIFSVLGMIQSISSTVGWIYQSQGRTDLMLKWGIASSVLLLGSIGFGTWLGTINSVATCYALTEGIILLYPAFDIPGRLIGLTFGDVVKSVAGCLGCAIGMAIAVWIIGLLLPTYWSAMEYLIVESGCGVVVYVLLVHLFNVRPYLDAKQLAEQYWDQYRKKQMAPQKFSGLIN